MKVRKCPIRAVSTVLAALLLCAAWLGGCAAPAPPQDLATAFLAAEDFSFVWDQTLESLRKMGFQPDRQDRSNRVIITLPETSAQWFEWWRSDVADPYSMTESSIQTVHRVVTIQYGAPTADGKPIPLTVRVDVSRLFVPERQITTASNGLNLFSARVPTVEGERQESGIRRNEWVLLGRDAAQEQRVLDRILAACGGQVAAADLPVESAPTTTPSTTTTTLPTSRS